MTDCPLLMLLMVQVCPLLTSFHLSSVLLILRLQAAQSINQTVSSFSSKRAKLRTPLPLPFPRLSPLCPVNQQLTGICYLPDSPEMSQRQQLPKGSETHTSDSSGLPYRLVIGKRQSEAVFPRSSVCFCILPCSKVTTWQGRGSRVA